MSSGHRRFAVMRRTSMTTSIVNTAIIGGGQAGLAVSYYLTRHALDHVVLEQADRPADAWRNHRWDSFALNTPRWQSRLPGVPDGGQDPDGFMSREEIVARLEDLARPLPVRCRAHVGEIEHHGLGDYYVVKLDSGERIRARNVVVATGLHQTPKIPAISGGFPADIRQFHSDTYRNPKELLPGAVLVVGSAQSGAQIAEELHESGRKVYLAVSRAGRTPRRYRGKDANWWSVVLGLYDRKVGDLPSPKAKFASKPHISGTRGGHTINLHEFARQGIVLLGRLAGVAQGVITLAPDLHANLAAADRFEADFTRAIDAYVEATGMAAPSENLPVFADGFRQPMPSKLDLRAADITNVIWATGYAFDFSMVRLPVLDKDGYPIQMRGVTAYPGLFFVGLPWLHDARSGLIYGVERDAAYVADQIAARQRSETPRLGEVQSVTANPLPTIRATKRRLFNAFASSAVAFILEGVAVHAAELQLAVAPSAAPCAVETEAEPGESESSPS
jgi:putative flavoprotein involved in K+ transport